MIVKQASKKGFTIGNSHDCKVFSMTKKTKKQKPIMSKNSKMWEMAFCLFPVTLTYCWWRKEKLEFLQLFHLFANPT